MLGAFFALLIFPSNLGRVNFLVGESGEDR